MNGGAVLVRRLLEHEWQAYRAIRLRALAQAPEAFGSTLAREEELPDETWAARVAKSVVSGIDCALVAEQGGAFIGLLWAKVDAQDAGRVNLFQMWVAPQWRGRGVAAALPDEALAWARARGTRVVHLGVNSENAGALRLYGRAGFRPIGEPYLMREGAPHMEQEMRLILTGAA
ncbi:N-acetyltransferase [Massilia varians]|uniref:N-acetyltransferase n=1 Tax=Massilia varians TaxID=457921 RepID=A0ABM8C353_9BURK|nr:GNAT family N-acetyltransferase [Massilia varians]BDT57615.1 N-acetyltransferase [Massilia varians]